MLGFCVYEWWWRVGETVFARWIKGSNHALGEDALDVNGKNVISSTLSRLCERHGFWILPSGVSTFGGVGVLHQTLCY